MSRWSGGACKHDWACDKVHSNKLVAHERKLLEELLTKRIDGTHGGLGAESLPTQMVVDTMAASRKFYDIGVSSSISFQKMTD